MGIEGGPGEKNLKPSNLTKMVKGGVFFPSGTRVTISGLSGAAHLNGKEGNIVSKDAATGRYTVNVDDVGEKNLKADNLTKSSALAKPKPKAEKVEENIPSDLPVELQEEGFKIGYQVRAGGVNNAKELN